MSKLLNKKIKN